LHFHLFIHSFILLSTKTYHSEAGTSYHIVLTVMLSVLLTAL